MQRGYAANAAMPSLSPLLNTASVLTFLWTFARHRRLKIFSPKPIRLKSKLETTDCDSKSDSNSETDSAEAMQYAINPVQTGLRFQKSAGPGPGLAYPRTGPARLSGLFFDNFDQFFNHFFLPEKQKFPPLAPGGSTVG